MSAISNILKSRRKELGLTLSQIADQMGVSEATVQRWESGNIKNLRHERIGPLAELLHVHPSVLMGWSDEDQPPAPNLLPAPSFVRKPRLGRVACGQPILAEEHIEDFDLVPDDIKCDFTLVCKGDSMINARIFDGDIVCVRQQEEVENGQIAVVMVDEDEATLKRFYRYDDHIELRAENPSFRDKAFWDEDMARVRVLGRATHCIAPIK